MKASHSHNKADYVGIAGSVLCIIHCLLVPAAVAFGSGFGHVHHADFSLLSLDMLFILINGLAVFYATRDHKSVPVRILLWGGLLVFSVSLIFESRLPVFSWLGYAGSALLIIGHFANLYICQIAPRLKYKSF
ncbi:MerC domain-containing protein [Dyadobacter sandarakinus]|uniref:MerC domain-containing protein n=1 Tax=Dyadobacter sandarakinus TaxID=2747268 RepID=A0ABX7IDI6_9BACT|nr:MerC domain-containing protein [Dyadobacter sandarakinus]QRR03507.1 MerC domain-containing protein [Dyadobacter sandarakinus]